MDGFLGSDVLRSGDGYVELVDGSRRWGLFGAAGVLLRSRAEEEARYFVAKRSERVHLGGVWAIPGGALNRGESPLVGALRELAEETGLAPAKYEVAAEHHRDHGVWSYRTFLLDVPPQRFDASALNWETDEVRWVTIAELSQLELLPAFRDALVALSILNDDPRDT